MYLLIAAGTALTFMISAELELFEEFYEFSRAHEDWELDELAVLILNLTAGLMVALVVRSRQLSKLATERDNAERQAQQVALNDALTGLPNRRALMDHLQSLGRTGSKHPAWAARGQRARSQSISMSSRRFSIPKGEKAMTLSSLGP